MQRSAIFTLILVLTGIPGQAQVKKADRHYENFRYARAIPLYEKALGKKENPLALQNLANAYRLTKNYVKAEEAYAKVVKLPNIPPVTHFYYGHVLLCNNKMEEAKKEFIVYSMKEKDNKLAENQLKNIEFLKLLLNQPAIYEVKNFSQVNSEKSEFSPAFYKDAIAFVSEREADLVNFNKFEWNNQPYLNIFYIPVKNEGENTFYGDIQKMPSIFNSYYHDGPVVFSNNYETAFFTRVLFSEKKDESYINKPRLFTTRAEKGKWEKPELLPFVKEDYSFAHPAVSEDGETLIFSSDIPGGQGGLDLYVTYKIGNIWSEPRNLGPGINTPEDELFPYLRKDKTLFFSSRGHSGFGGMDIFYARQRKDGKWEDVTNMGAPLNSYTDDFGIIFNPDNKSGYFSSDRGGGKGKDDIYNFRISKNLVAVSGRILQSKNINDPVENLRIFLMTEEGLPINIKETDTTGYFRFENLPAERKYMVKLDENDPSFTGKEKYYLADDKGNIVRGTVYNEKGGMFVFESLPSDTLSLQADQHDDQISISGTLLAGSNPSRAVASTLLKIQNENGEVKGETRTNALGSFSFMDLNPDGNYSIVAEESDSAFSGQKIVLTSKNGKEINATIAGKKGTFRFEFLKSGESNLKMMEVSDTEISVNLKGMLLDSAKNPIGNAVIKLVNDKGEVIRHGLTDAKGKFIFERLPADQVYLVNVDESEDSRIVSADKIFLADEQGNVLKELVKNSDRKFRYRLLPSELYMLREVYTDDPWIRVLEMKKGKSDKKDSLNIIEDIYYEVNDWKILPEARKTLDKVALIMKSDPRISILISSHTDSRAGTEYNLALSQKRAKAAVDYIISLGINRTRIRGKGFGEGKLINACKDGVECTEEQHAQNRRTEFKVVRK